MRKYKVIINQIKTVEVNIIANSAKEAERKINDIVENTDILSKCDADETILIKGFTEGGYGTLCCDADCENCPFDDDEECLYDELY